LTFAFAEANSLGAPLVTVHAWSEPPIGPGEAAAVLASG
jgi:hypothetical protein